MAGIGRLLALPLVGGLLLAAPAAAPAAIVSNGSFETADLLGWGTDDTPGGFWTVYSAGSVIAVTVAAPPLGNHAAVAVQQSVPSRQILYQDLTLPPKRFKTQLSLFAFYQAHTALASPETLAPSGVNEQYRVDVLRAGAPLDSVAPGDVLATPFRTRPGDASFLGATQVTADLSRYAGQSVRLRFAVVATEGALNGGVDVVGVTGLDLGKARPNTRRGTAALPVTVTDAGTVRISGKAVKRRSVSVRAGTTKVRIEPRGGAARALSTRGSARVKAKITYTIGAAEQTQTAKLKLKRG
jgi:hypothetical protein